MTSKKGWMIMKKIEKLDHKAKKFTSFYLFLSFILIGCGTTTNNSECADCGEGLVDGYLYKNVMVEDITTSLLEIDSSIGLDECIRYKTDGTDFTDAIVVDDCCCSIY